MTRTLDNCKVIYYYGKPAQNNGVCEGVIYKGGLHPKCHRCYLHDIKNATKICIVCGKEFTATNPKSKVCSAECKAKRKNESRAVKKPKEEKKTLDEVLKDVDEYNRTHGTHLTYGKYQNMKFIEKLRQEKQNENI